MKQILAIFLCMLSWGVYALPTNPVIKITANPSSPLAVTQTLPVGTLHTQRICSGQQIKLEAISSGTGTLTFQWLSVQTGLVVGTGAIITLPLGDGQYNARITDETGAITSTTTIIVCVETAPPFNATITSNGVTSICTNGGGADIILTANASNPAGNPACSSPDFRYKWYKNNVLISGANAASLTLGQQTTNAGLYRVEIYNSCGFAQASLNVGTANTPPLEVTVYGEDGTSNFCVGGSLVLKVTAVGIVDSYQWFKVGTPAVIGVGNSFTVSTSGSYYVKARNGCGEKQSANFTVGSTTAPTTFSFQSNPSSGSLCKDGYVLLAPVAIIGGAPTKVEYFKNDQLIYTANHPFSNGLAYQATQAGTYKVRISNKCGALMSSNTKVVTPSDGATQARLDLTGTSPSLGCGVTNITLNVLVNGTTNNYTWYQDYSPVSNDPSFMVEFAGVYYAQIDTPCGSFFSDTVEVADVTDPPLSNIALTTANGLTTCEGKITLTCTDAGLGSAYQWFKNGALYQTSAKNSLEATESGTYKVKAVNACGASNLSNELDLVVKKKANKPSISAPAGSFVCSGTGNIPLLMMSAQEVGILYQWLKNGAPIAGATSDNYQATESGTYSLRATNPANDCPAQESDAIEVRFTITPNQSSLYIQANICESPLVLKAMSNGNFLQYRWFLLDGITNPQVGTAETFTPTVSGRYTVSVRNDCLPAGVWLSSEPAEATVSAGGSALPIPTVDSEPSGIDRICPNATLKLKAQINGTIPSPAYRWFEGDRLMANETSQTLIVAKSGLYRAEVYSLQNPSCGQVSAPYSVFVRPTPTLLLTYSPSLVFCEGDSIRLGSNAQQTPLGFSWSLDNTFLNTGTLIYAKKGGKYTVEAQYDAGTLSFPCAYTTSLQISADMLPAPVPEILVEGGLLESKHKAQHYQWNYEGIPILGANEPFFMPLDSGRYSLTVTNDLGCSGTSNFTYHKGVYKDVTPPLQVSPNPNNGSFRVTVVGEDSEIKVQVFNAQGQMLLPTTAPERLNSLASHIGVEFRQVPRGMYLVKASVGERVYVKKVVVF